MQQKEIILEVLKSMGFEPVNMDDTGFVFKYEDLNYMYMPDDEDEQFLRIVIPHIFEVTEENRTAVLEAIQESSLLMKYAKLNIIFESVWTIYEHRLTFAENLSELLEHIIRVLAVTMRVFFKKIRGEDVEGRISGNTDDTNESDDELEAELQKILESVDSED